MVLIKSRPTFSSFIIIFQFLIEHAALLPVPRVNPCPRSALGLSLCLTTCLHMWTLAYLNIKAAFSTGRPQECLVALDQTPV